MQIPGHHPELLYHMGSRNLWQKVDACCAVKGKHITLGIQKKKKNLDLNSLFTTHQLCVPGNQNHITSLHLNSQHLYKWSNNQKNIFPVLCEAYTK